MAPPVIPPDCGGSEGTDPVIAKPALIMKNSQTHSEMLCENDSTYVKMLHSSIYLIKIKTMDNHFSYSYLTLSGLRPSDG